MVVVALKTMAWLYESFQTENRVVCLSFVVVFVDMNLSFVVVLVDMNLSFVVHSLLSFKMCEIRLY